MISIELLESRLLRAADLVVASLHTTPGVALRPDALRVFGSIKNIGDAAFPDSARTVRLFISTSPVLGEGTDYGLGRLSLGEIAPGQTVTFDRFTDVPSGAPAGTYYVTAMADPDEAVAEDSETNNTRGTPKATVTISDATSPVPDTATLDATFGTSGTVRATLAGRRVITDATLTDSQGRLLVAGATFDDGKNILLRFLPSGALDTSFGNGGLVSTELFGSNFRSPLAVTPEGKIYYVGSSTGQLDDGTPTSVVGIYRFNDDGSADATYGNNGLVLSDIGSKLMAGVNSYSLSVPLPVSVDDYAAGTAVKATDVNPKYASAAPTLRAESGTVTQSVAGSLVLDEKGRVYVCARVTVGGDTDMGVARFTADGVLDTTFATTGAASVDFNGLSDEAAALALTPDGGVIIAGNSTNDETTNGATAIAKFDENGKLDVSFGRGVVKGAGGGIGGGILFGPMGPTTGAHDVDVDSRGRVLVSGSITTGTLDENLGGVSSVYRLTGAGKLDASFGTKGVTQVAVPSYSQNTVRSLDLLPGGKIVLGSLIGRDVLSVFNSRNGLAVTRLNSNGKVDTTFATAGSAVLFGPDAPVLAADSSIRTAGVRSAGASSASFSSVELTDTTTGFDNFSRQGAAILAVTPSGQLLALATSLSDTDTLFTLEALLPDGPNLVAAISSIAPSAIGGETGTAVVKVSNTGSLKASGNVRIAVKVGDQILAMPTSVLKLGAGSSKTVKVPVTFQAVTANASLSATATIDSPDGTVADVSVTDNVSPARTIQLVPATTLFSLTALSVKKTGTTATLTLRIGNTGNTKSAAPLNLSFFASDDGVLSESDALLTTLVVPVALGPGKSVVKKVVLAGAALPFVLSVLGDTTLATGL